LKADLGPALERMERGEAGVPFDVEEIKRRGRERLARQGIAD
jgi:hypothetical protein